MSLYKFEYRVRRFDKLTGKTSTWTAERRRGPGDTWSRCYESYYDSRSGAEAACETHALWCKWKRNEPRNSPTTRYLGYL